MCAQSYKPKLDSFILAQKKFFFFIVHQTEKLFENKAVKTHYVEVREREKKEGDDGRL